MYNSTYSLKKDEMKINGAAKVMIKDSLSKSVNKPIHSMQNYEVHGETIKSKNNIENIARPSNKLWNTKKYFRIQNDQHENNNTNHFIGLGLQYQSTE